MSNETKRILTELRQIRGDVKFIKKHVTDLDVLLLQRTHTPSRVSKKITLDQMFKEARKLKKHNFTPEQLDEIEREMYT